jgi:hypothetical protein
MDVQNMSKNAKVKNNGAKKGRLEENKLEQSVNPKHNVLGRLNQTLY